MWIYIALKPHQLSNNFRLLVSSTGDEKEKDSSTQSERNTNSQVLLACIRPIKVNTKLIFMSDKFLLRQITTYGGRLDYWL